MRAGADGFLLKTASPTEIMAGIRSVHAGQGVLSPMSAGQAIRSVHGDPGVEARRAAAATSMAGLTGRERAVCVLVARGMTNSAVGARLFMSEATVKTHLASAQARLGVGNRVEVAVLIERVGLLDERPGGS